MITAKRIKVVFVGVFSLLFIGWIASGAFTNAHGRPAGPGDTGPDITAMAANIPTTDGDYVGSDSCKTCHEEQFNNFAGTKHAKLKEVASWKDKVQGCESCHGPGKAHLEDAMDPKKIISFKGKNSKAVSETCLSCHSGKESHNNFRRGEHWRNDVGCTDCHSPHGSPLGNFHPDSDAFVSGTTRQNPGIATVAMLRQSERPGPRDTADRTGCPRDRHERHGQRRADG